MKDYIKANWKQLLLTAAVTAATVQGGPAAGAAVRNLLPALCAAVGLC